MPIRDASIVQVTTLHMDYDDPDMRSLRLLADKLHSPEPKARRRARRALKRCGAMQFELTASKQQLVDKGLAKWVLRHPATGDKIQPN